MTDKERLEEIKEKTSSIAEPMLYIDWYDTKWLIKQAERVQELEDIIYQDARQDVLEGLYEENKRYQDLLKAITGLMETDAEIYLTDKARLNGIHDELVEFYKEDSK